MIFVSYSREDKAWATQIVTTLRARGRRVARDPALVQGDPFWRSKVRDALEQSTLMLVLWSGSAAHSPWVDQELRNFSGKKLFLQLDQMPLPELTPPSELPADGQSEPATVGLIEGIEHWLAHLEPTAAAHLATSLAGDGESIGEFEDSAEINRQRRHCQASEEARLQQFRSALGDRVPKTTRLNEHMSRLEDGTVLIRLPDAVAEQRAASDEVYVAAMPVTNAQYGRFLQATGYPPPPTWDEVGFRVPEAPVVGVTWFESSAYASWAGGSLPTAAEWEWAATGGDKRVEYATSTGRLARHEAHFGVPLAEGAPKLNSDYAPNRLGFYGLCGNTWDWCATEAGLHRVIRGGGYMDSPRFCKTKAWYRNNPVDRDCCVGFRLKLTVKTNLGG